MHMKYIYDLPYTLGTISRHKEANPYTIISKCDLIILEF